MCNRHQNQKINYLKMEKMVEDEAQMLAFLEHLRAQDPALYEQTMTAMQQQIQQHQLQQGSGGGSGAMPPASASVDNSGGGGADVLNNMSGMLDALRQAKGGDGGDGAKSNLFDGLNMPGMTKVLGKDGVEDKKPGIMITPEPGFVIKTKEISSVPEKKIMVNLCIHASLDKPSLKKKLDENGEPVEGMNIPLSVGAAHESTDKAGVTCTVYDIIVNPSVLTEFEEDETGRYRDFLCQLCIQALESKYKMTLDKRYKLPKLKFIGELQQQYIQDRSKAPKIEELSESNATAQASKKQQQLAAKKKAEQMMSAPLVRADIPLATYAISWYQIDPAFSVSDMRSSNAVDLAPADEQDLVTQCSSSEYVEPMCSVPEGKNAIRFLGDVSECTDFNLVDIQVSAYRIKVRLLY
jgi:hypothetical protein